MATETFDSRVPWLGKRRKYIGSSDGPAVLGFGYATQSSTTVWRSKVFDEEPRFDQKTLDLMNEGRICEPFVVNRFAVEHPEWKVDPGTPFDVTVSAEHPFLAASLDATATVCEETFPVECKWIGRHMSREWDDGACPMKYQIQLMHQIICSGAKRGCVAAFVGGEYTERWFDRDEEVVEWMLAKYREFWQCVIDRVPPDDSSPVAFRELRPNLEYGVAKVAGGELSGQARFYLDAAEKAAEYRVKADRARNAIAAGAGGVEYLILDDQSVLKLGKNTVKQVRKLPRGVRVQ